MHKVYWITGLAGSGKSTLAAHLCESLQRQKVPIIYLDGDVLREIFQDNIGYSYQERLKAAWRNARLCKILTDQGVTVVCATISMFHEVQLWNRNNIKNYYEIFLDVPMDVLIKRNQKGLYTKAKGMAPNNVVGVDIPSEFPLNPDMIVHVGEGVHLTVSKILDINKNLEC
jgi:adenylylsulfate kinase